MRSRQNVVRKVRGIAYRFATNEQRSRAGPLKPALFENQRDRSAWSDPRIKLTKEELNQDKLKWVPIHDEHQGKQIGYITDSEIIGNSLWIEASILGNTEEGLKAIEELDKNKRNGFSINYVAIPDQTGTRILHKSQPFEISTVETPHFEECRMITIAASKKRTSQESYEKSSEQRTNKQEPYFTMSVQQTNTAPPAAEAPKAAAPVQETKPAETPAAPAQTEAVEQPLSDERVKEITQKVDSGVAAAEELKLWKQRAKQNEELISQLMERKLRDIQEKDKPYFDDLKQRMGDNYTPEIEKTLLSIAGSEPTQPLHNALTALQIQASKVQKENDELRKQLQVREKALKAVEVTASGKSKTETKKTYKEMFGQPQPKFFRQLAVNHTPQFQNALDRVVAQVRGQAQTAVAPAVAPVRPVSAAPPAVQVTASKGPVATAPAAAPTFNPHSANIWERTLDRYTYSIARSVGPEKVQEYEQRDPRSMGITGGATSEGFTRK